MESFQWDAHFETGLGEIDQQHQHLVDLINSFGEQLLENRSSAKDLENIYQQLAEYSVYHFKAEEQLMARYKLDHRHVDGHVQAHARFLDEVTNIYANLAENDIEQYRNLFSYLMHWLAYHILGADHDMAAQIKSVKEGATPYQAFDQQHSRHQDHAREPLLLALNGLFEQISLRNRQLKQLNESLEEKIGLRTQELLQANARLKQLSLTDSLTGLPNRRYAMHMLDLYWQEAITQNLSLCCMMIDVDRFKLVNDRFGHNAGDVVLNAISQAIKGQVRNDDLACRLGGDEFFVICPSTHLKGAKRLADKILLAVSSIVTPLDWPASVSIGLAMRDPRIRNPSELIGEADHWAYQAKSAGRNCVRSAIDQ